VHALYQKANKISHDVIGTAIEVHRRMGSGLIESIYERCMVRELELRSIPAATQQLVRIQYKGIVFDEPLRFDILVIGEGLTSEIAWSRDFAVPLLGEWLGGPKAVNFSQSAPN
jgi:hypothetical protein